MSSLLIHITTGPNDPTRAALGFLIAKTAAEEGHEVNMFLAGDAVQLIRDSVLDNLVGLGTGKIREHYDAIVQNKVTLYLSGMSCASRGITDKDLENKPVEKAIPNVLVQLTMDADKVLTY
jgi:predicted peroxiredoxin